MGAHRAAFARKRAKGPAVERPSRKVINGILCKLRTGAPWRGIATRYEKRAVNYRAAVVIAALMIWLVS
jgi:transposase